MPIKKQDTTRALELLEDYHRQLNSPDDIQLRSAIERVIKIFKSKLFNALLEIQEFYEATLLDESKTVEQKTMETMKVAERWANSQGLGGPPGYPHFSGAFSSLGRLQLLPQPLASSSSSEHQQLQQFDASNGTSSSITGGHYNQQHLRHQTPPPPPPPPPLSDADALGQPLPSAPFEAVLERTGHGFGFSIAGGTDAAAAAAASAAIDGCGTSSSERPPDDSRIRVTRIVPGGAADGRLAVGDALLAVNGVDVACVTHAEAVEALRLAGGRLRLLVLRGPAPPPPPPPPLPPPPQNQQQYREIHVLLNKTFKGLGFSIAGGLHNEHLPGDSGIFITKLIDGGAAQLDGRIAVGDRLLSVNGAPLVRVTHEEAVAALKRTGSEVLLSVVKPTPEQLAALAGMESEAEAAEAEAAAVAAGQQPQLALQRSESAALEFAPAPSCSNVGQTRHPDAQTALLPDCNFGDRSPFKRLSLALPLPRVAKPRKDADHLICADSFIYFDARRPQARSHSECHRQLHQVQQRRSGWQQLACLFAFRRSQPPGVGIFKPRIN